MVELVTNGAFAADTDWSKGSGVTISGGRANMVGAGQFVYQPITYDIGADYRCTFDYLMTVGSKIRINVQAANGAAVVGVSAALSTGVAGSLTFDFTAPSGANYISIEADRAFFDGWIDNVSLQKITGATSYTLTAAVGAFTLSGQAANLRRGYLHTAAVGAFTLTGQAANLVRGKGLPAEAGAFSLSGQPAALRVALTLTASPATFALAGQDATLTYVPFSGPITLTAETGAFALNGQAANLNYSSSVLARSTTRMWQAFLQ